ncbi:hypothetical protein [Chlamydia suis]|uniref:hypothetical protein n=1 Tax=Chlamydia suis TaxID=83559 RepID=UPI00214BC062|nr:hypothetical protein [Chlamydia suis]
MPKVRLCNHPAAVSKTLISLCQRNPRLSLDLSIVRTSIFVCSQKILFNASTSALKDCSDNL